MPGPSAASWLALGAGSMMLIGGAARRSARGAFMMLCSAPFLYRGLTGHWPMIDGSMSGDTRSALSGSRGIHVRQSIEVERPVADVYRFWRNLQALPRFMSHLESVQEQGARRSHWKASGPGGISVEWDAEIINEIENQLLAWRSLPDSDVTTAGSVRFAPVRKGNGTAIRVHLQYTPPAGKAGAAVASLFGREPSQMIREDLSRLKELLERREDTRTDAQAS